MKNKRIVILGGGNMGYAIASRILNSYSVRIIEASTERRAYIAKELPKLECLESFEFAEDFPYDLVVLAIKPQDFLHIAATLPRNTSYLSVLAGIPLRVLKKELQSEKIARIMPSLTAKIGKAVTGYCIDSEQFTDAAFVSLTQSIASSLGTLVIVPESLIPAVTALSGSGIAFVFRFIHDFAMAAVAEGIAYPTALSLVQEVLLGAVLYTKEQGTEGKTPVELITKVCSPGGTTIAGIQALDALGFSPALQKAVSAVVSRSKEMESSL